MKKAKSEPLWKGPEDKGPMGGITQSLLSRWLYCRERTRLAVIEGLRPADNFSARVEYGNMWHACEEGLAANGNWAPNLQSYCRELVHQYPYQQSEVAKWYEICKRQFPIYIDYWRRQPDVTARTPLYQEQVFHVPYGLPSGRIVWLRGKFDSVDIIGKGKQGRVYLQENKSKGNIDPLEMRRNLTFDLQTGIYLTSLRIHFDTLQEYHGPIAGIRYNVIRRPLSGGKHSIVQKKGSKNVAPETKAEYYNRLAGLIKQEADEALAENRECHYFMRWKVEVGSEHLRLFQTTCLDPILEQLCDWYTHVSEAYKAGADPFTFSCSGACDGIHFRYPYGVYNPTLEGNASEYDEYLLSGSLAGLHRVDSLFGELQ